MEIEVDLMHLYANLSILINLIPSSLLYRNYKGLHEDKWGKRAILKLGAVVLFIITNVTRFIISCCCVDVTAVIIEIFYLPAGS